VAGSRANRLLAPPLPSVDETGDQGVAMTRIIGTLVVAILTAVVVLAWVSMMPR
jgi:hypothetical protein